MASIFGGNMFGGGGFMGQSAPGMQFGGGWLLNPTAQAQTTQEVQLNTQGQVTYAIGPYSVRPKDRSGRIHRQKRY